MVNAPECSLHSSLSSNSQPNSANICTNFQWTWPLNQFTASSCTDKPAKLILIQPQGVQGGAYVPLCKDRSLRASTPVFDLQTLNQLLKRGHLSIGKLEARDHNSLTIRSLEMIILEIKEKNIGQKTFRPVLMKVHKDGELLQTLIFHDFFHPSSLFGNKNTR